MFNQNPVKTNPFTPYEPKARTDDGKLWQSNHARELAKLPWADIVSEIRNIDDQRDFADKLSERVTKEMFRIGIVEPIKARTDDDGKPPLAQLPWAAIKDLARVQSYGQKKYGDFNNYRKGMEVSRQLSCALRHISEYMEGNNTDAESGLNPLAHALCRLAFVLQNIHDGVAIDDRYAKP